MILVLREELLRGLYCGNFRTLVGHTTRFLEQKSRALYSTVVRVIEVSQHLPVLLPRINLQQPSGRSKAFSAIL